MQKVRCHLHYQKCSKKRHQSSSDCDSAPALLPCVKCSSSHLPSQPQPSPLWSATGLATPEPVSLQTPLSCGFSTPSPSCPVKLLCVTPLWEQSCFRGSSALAGPWPSQPSPTEMPGDAKMQRRLMPLLRATTVTFSSFCAICLNYRALPNSVFSPV